MLIVRYPYFKRLHEITNKYCHVSVMKVQKKTKKLASVAHDRVYTGGFVFSNSSISLK